MDVDTDGQRLAEPNPDKDIMDTTSDGAPVAVEKVGAPAAIAVSDVPAVTTEVIAPSESTPVLERPREEGVGGAQQSPTHLRKTPY